MKKFEVKRLLSGLNQPVVALGSEPNHRGECKKVDKLIRRAKNAFDLQIDDNTVLMPDGQRIHLLAEVVNTVEVVGCGAPTRWRVIRVIRHGQSSFYAIRADEWDKHPALPDFNLAKAEVEAVYMMCEQLSRSKAFREVRLDAASVVTDDVDSNVSFANDLGELDERRLLVLLQRDPLALHALEAVVLTGVWANLTADELPDFAINFVVDKNAKSENYNAFLQHFRAIDLFRSPNMRFGGPIVLEADTAKDLDALIPLYGRLVFVKANVSKLRDQLIDKLRANARMRAVDTPQHPAFPLMLLTVGSTAWPEDVALNVLLGGNIHPLTPDEADTLRLAAARLLEDCDRLAWQLHMEMHRVAQSPYAYARSAVEVWMETVHRVLLPQLFDDPQIREEARHLFADLCKEEREALYERIRKIEKGIDFMLSPERYADVLLDEKPGDVDVFADATAFRCSADGGRVIAFNKVKLPGLLLRAGVPADLIEEVVDGLKSRGIISHASVKIRIGKDTPRVLAIPVEKLQSSTVPGVPGDSGEADGDE